MTGRRRSQVQVWINGAAHEVPDRSRVAVVLDVLGLPGRGVAVAVDGELVRRADWPQTPLAEGARVEVVTAVQGG
jgi:sulfur carrier protein